MPQITIYLSSFNPTGDKAAGAQFTASAPSTNIQFANVTSASLTLTNIRTYTQYTYLEFHLGSYFWDNHVTAVFPQNDTTHTATVALTSFNNSLLVQSSNVTFWVRRTSGTGNTFNVRENTTGYITVNYETIPRPVFYRHIDTWLRATQYQKVGGVWRTITPYVKVGGVWREIIGGWG